MRSTFKNNNNAVSDLNLHAQLVQQLTAYREQRKFNPSLYITAKKSLLSRYLHASGIKSCVIGVSGGVDSAVSLAILNTILTENNSPLTRIIPALLPKFGEGATNQDTALARGHEVINALGLDAVQIDLSFAHTTLQASVEKSLGIKGTSWSAGQLVSNLRTPALYHLATLMTENKQTCVVCGTTNRDEGSYLGFFGKASDGMVDVQPISDLHKSEVYILAKHLGVPHSVIAAEPTGDTFDGSTDMEMLGVPYDFIELYSYYLNLSAAAKLDMLNELDVVAKSQFETLAARMEQRHQINAHKYLGGSQAIHFDVQERCVRGGWRHNNSLNMLIKSSNVVGYFDLDASLLHAFAKPQTTTISCQQLGDFGESALLLDHVLSDLEADTLFNEIKKREIKKQTGIPVARDGYAHHFNPDTDTPGSYRSTTYDETLAGIIWRRIQQHVPALRILDEYSAADWQGHDVWRVTGVNPLLRFIHYQTGGSLIPHFDEGHDFHDGRRTLMSVIIYLSDALPDEGGHTRLLNDNQRNLPVNERDFSDRTTQAHDDDVLACIYPRKGRVLIFDHRILHEATAWIGTCDRILLRTDIIFERCGLQSDSAEKSSGLPAECNLPWKIMRDPFYGSALKVLLSLEAIEKAGFLDTGEKYYEEKGFRFSPAWLMTPVHKIMSRLRQAGDKRLVVLVTTGALAPVHTAHIEMMEQAKQALEQRGDYVLGGYLSPSHQSYVTVKCGANALSAEERIGLCERAVSTTDWLMVDNWEAVQNDRPVNFTDVIIHLSRYLAQQIKSHRAIHVVYVFGSDNASFALAFLKRGMCVCIPRAGHEQDHADMARHPLIRGNPRIIMADPGNSPSAFSSSQIRDGDHTALPTHIRNCYEQMRGKHSRDTKMYLRDEKDWVLEPWEPYCNPAELRAETKSFMARLTDILQASFLGANQNISIEILDLNEQRSNVKRLYENKNIISLDSCIDGAVNLGVSRCFQLASPDNPGEFVARPGYPSLAQQFNSIPAGDYILLDDDIATGGTINFIKKSLPDGCEIQEIVSLCNLQAEAASNDMTIELCDFRDFLVGARNAGLVVRLPNGKIARAPYILPYVRPSARIKLPMTQEIMFSHLIWQINHDFFRHLNSILQVRHADAAFQSLACYLGFSKDTTMEDVCQWHVDRLTNILLK